MLVFLLAMIAVAAGQSASATITLNFGKMPRDGLIVKNIRYNLCPEMRPTSFQNLNTPAVIQPNGDAHVTLTVTGLNDEGATVCTVTVEENEASVQREFRFFDTLSYEWLDMTAVLKVHIEWWNPWCALTPINNANAMIFNGGGLVLQVVDPVKGPTAFREYTSQPAFCANAALNWTYFPHLDLIDEYFGESCNELGYFDETPEVTVLRTMQDVTVYAQEYRNGQFNVAADCVNQVGVLGHDGTIYPPNAPNTLGRVITTDTVVMDGFGDSGVLIARLQVPNLCVEPNPDRREKLGQFWAGGERFPATSLLLNFDGEQNNPRGYRWYAGEADTRLTFYVIANNLYTIGAQYSDPMAAPGTSLTVGSLAKVPVASCYQGSCEAQPITSTLYIDTQGHCSDIDSIGIRQQSYQQTGTTELFSNFKPDCSNVTEDNGQLLFCVFNLDNTDVTIEYNLHGTSNTVDVPIPSIDCQNTAVSQVCRSPGGLAALCPEWGCLADPESNGPTQLNVAVTYNTSGQDYVLSYQVGHPADLENGCLWVPALPDMKLTVSEGCCAYPVEGGYNANGFTGCGCVQVETNTTECAPGGQCTTLMNLGRLLSVFDTAYLPEDPGVSTTSVALEPPATAAEECCPFRFKTQQGGGPRCYCVLPIELRARIIETNLLTSAQACKSTEVESCVQLYRPERETDCSICDFLSAFHFDLTGLPQWTQADLYVGPYESNTSQDADMKLLREYNHGVGNLDNWISVLRTGDTESQQPCSPNQTYCLKVTENAAELERCISCSGKICEPKGFTRNLCLDLSNPCPNGTVSGLLDVSLFTSTPTWSYEKGAPTHDDAPEFWVRTVRGQGGVNGCDPDSILILKKDVAPEQKDAEQYDAEILLSMTEEELIDYESRQADALRLAHEKASRGVLTGVNNGQYTVLAIPYDVVVFEQNVRVLQSTDCTMMSETAYCNATNFLNCMCWNSTCRGDAPGSAGNGGAIPSDNIWISLGTAYNPCNAAEAATCGTGNAASCCNDVQPWKQIRGPRGYWSQDLETCSWSIATWTNATWERAGNQAGCFPVLQADNLALRVEEGLTSPPAPIWPDPRGHPTVTVDVDCTYPSTPIPSGPWAGWSCRQWDLKPDCYCRVEPAQIYSIWNIISLRGVPSQGSELIFKYTDPSQKTSSNQGVYRAVPADMLAIGAGQENDPTTWVQGINYFCQVADPLYAFYFNWGAFAFPPGTMEFPGVTPNALMTQFSCDADIVPRALDAKWWQDGMNLCRGCGLANSDSGPNVHNPCLFGGADSLTTYFCESTDLSPASSYPGTPAAINETTSELCRVSVVYPGSDNVMDLPLGTIIKLPFF